MAFDTRFLRTFYVMALISLVSFASMRPLCQVGPLTERPPRRSLVIRVAGSFFYLGTQAPSLCGSLTILPAGGGEGAWERSLGGFEGQAPRLPLPW